MQCLGIFSPAYLVTFSTLNNKLHVVFEVAALVVNSAQGNGTLSGLLNFIALEMDFQQWARLSTDAARSLPLVAQGLTCVGT